MSGWRDYDNVGHKRTGCRWQSLQSDMGYCVEIINNNVLLIDINESTSLL